MLVTMLMFIFLKFLPLIFFGGQFCPTIRSSSKWLKFRRGVNCCMLITILMFIFSKFLSFIYFGLIWSQNLKFSKLTEIWDKRTFLYACYKGNVYFSKIFTTHIFWGQFFPTIWSSSKWLKFRRGVNCCLLITILMIIFSKFLSVIFFWINLVPKSNVLQIDWSLIQGHIVICWFWFWCVTFQSVGYGANFIPKSVVLHIYWNLAQRYDEHV